MVKKQLDKEQKKNLWNQFDQFDLEKMSCLQELENILFQKKNILRVLNIKHKQLSQKIEILSLNMKALHDQIRNGIEVPDKKMAEDEEKKEDENKESDEEESSEESEEEKKEE